MENQSVKHENFSILILFLLDELFIHSYEVLTKYYWCMRMRTL